MEPGGPSSIEPNENGGEATASPALERDAGPAGSGVDMNGVASAVASVRKGPAALPKISEASGEPSANGYEPGVGLSALVSSKIPLVVVDSELVSGDRRASATSAVRFAKSSSLCDELSGTPATNG